jgi:hypothetical protein
MFYGGSYPAVGRFHNKAGERHSHDQIDDVMLECKRSGNRSGQEEHRERQQPSVAARK